MTAIDWTAPIEAVHEDGWVFPIEVGHGPDGDGNYVCCPSVEGLAIWRSDGKHYYKPDSVWRIRNVAQPATSTEGNSDRDALFERMAEYIRRDAENWPHGWSASEARAIVALLPAPVDPDLVAAKRFYEEWFDDRYDNLENAVFAAIKYGRAQQEAGK